MKRLGDALVALLAVVYFVLAPARAEDKCALQLAAKLDITVLPDGHFTVPMTIGGNTINMLVDTGSPFSTLTSASVDTLKLDPHRMPNGFFMIGYGGWRMTQIASASDIALANLKRDKMGFLVMPVRGSPEFGGLLGADIMGAYDVELDFAKSTMNMFSQDHCEGQVVYWTHEPYGRVPFVISGGHIRVTAQLDGKDIDVLMDSGAFDSVGSLDKIEDDFGINEGSPDLKLLAGSNKNVRAYKYPFKTMSFGDISVYNPDITLWPDDNSHKRHLFLVGMNVLRHLHLYIAYRERAVYVTPASAH